MSARVILAGAQHHTDLSVWHAGQEASMASASLVWSLDY